MAGHPSPPRDRAAQAPSTNACARVRSAPPPCGRPPPQATAGQRLRPGAGRMAVAEVVATAERTWTGAAQLQQANESARTRGPPWRSRATSGTPGQRRATPQPAVLGRGMSWPQALNAVGLIHGQSHQAALLQATSSAAGRLWPRARSPLRSERRSNPQAIASMAVQAWREAVSRPPCRQAAGIPPPPQLAHLACSAPPGADHQHQPLAHQAGKLETERLATRVGSTAQAVTPPAGL